MQNIANQATIESAEQLPNQSGLRDPFSKLQSMPHSVTTLKIESQQTAGQTTQFRDNLFSYTEETSITSTFKGTVIDIETIGNFSRKFSDSRQYKNIIPVIFGYITHNKLSILYSENKTSIPTLQEEIKNVLASLERPLYAFNSSFEMGSLYHNLNQKIMFEGELNKEKYEAKRTAVQVLNIPQYDDPFFDNGLLCMQAWEIGKTKEAIAHNRSCLLKERDILVKRGFREPEDLVFCD